ncbi:50S ribosomal protein L6 [Spirochaetota bacterium]|nr:50S ribosomal protein L6 [Spirochaetota bacterium]
MSRFENKPVSTAGDVEVSLKGSVLHAKGAKGENTFRIPSGVKVTLDEKGVVYSADRLENAARVGLCYRMTQNLISGVTTGFTKELEVNGVGYRWSTSDQVVKMQLGYSNDVLCDIPPGIGVAIKGNLLTVSGIDKQAVGAFAAKIRQMRPVEPYKGKGIRYKNEVVIKKVGKAGKTTGGGS